MKKIKTAFHVLGKLGTHGFIQLIMDKLHSYFFRKDRPVELSFSTTNEAISDVRLLLEKMIDIPAKTMENFRHEYSKYSEDFEIMLRRERKDYFNDIFDLGPVLREFLYVWTRCSVPALVIETGVAAGASTNTLLLAISRNTIGTLTSVDVNSKVGELVEQRFHRIWNLQILGVLFKKHKFDSVVRKNSTVELFVHDSDHSPSWQIFEFETVLLRSPGIKVLAFDDVTQELIAFVSSNYPEFYRAVLNEGRKYSALFYR